MKKPYNRLADVTDVVGIRVITHFESEVHAVSSLIEKEFEIDWENSVDKGKTLAPESFGYRSLHYICTLKDKGLEAENERFRGLKFEIQIRSILQHAWAEIEHPLGYKSGQGIPPEFRRRFSRLAGLLEMADQEFGAIRAELQHYESKVRSEIGISPGEVRIDNITLKAIFDKEVVVREIDEQLAKKISVVIKDNDDLLRILSAGLPTVGISTVAELIKELKQQRELLVFQALARYKSRKLEYLDRGVSVLQLLWVLMGLKGGEAGIVQGIAAMGLEGGPSSEEFAREVMSLIREFQARSKRK